MHFIRALLAGSSLSPRVVSICMAVDSAISIDWHYRGRGFRFPGRVGFPARKSPGQSPIHEIACSRGSRQFEVSHALLAAPVIRRVHQHLPATNQRQVGLAGFRQVRASRDLGPRT